MIRVPASQTNQLQDRVARAIRDVPDFPKPGIVFKDITPVLADPALFRDVIEAMAAPWVGSGITHIAGIESRGFIFAAPIALRLGAGMIPIRKPGKLPWQTKGIEYALEYGKDRLEMHVDACPGTAKVLVIDDVLATGGTSLAACELVLQGGGMIGGCGFFLGISELGGKAAIHSRIGCEVAILSG